MTDDDLLARFTEIDRRLQWVAAAIKALAEHDQTLVDMLDRVDARIAATLGTAAEPRPAGDVQQSEDIPADRAESPATLGTVLERGSL